MTRREFLEDIRESLEPEVSSAVLQENMKYYNDYFDEEIRKGRTEEEIISELGDPWALAKTIIDMEESKGNTQGYYNESENTSQESVNQKTKVFKADNLGKRILLFVGLAFMLFVIFSVVSGIVSIVAPIALPVILVLCVIRLFKNMIK